LESDAYESKINSLKAQLTRCWNSFVSLEAELSRPGIAPDERETILLQLEQMKKESHGIQLALDRLWTEKFSN